MDVLFKLLIDNIELVDNEFKLLNIVVDVAFKFGMSKYDRIDNELIILNIIVDVAFKSLINSVEFVDNELIFEFIANTDTPDVVISPITFNVVEHVVPPLTVIELLTASKVDDNVIYELPLIYNYVLNYRCWTTHSTQVLEHLMSNDRIFIMIH